MFRTFFARKRRIRVNRGYTPRHAAARPLIRFDATRLERSAGTAGDVRMRVAVRRDRGGTMQAGLHRKRKGRFTAAVGFACRRAIRCRFSTEVRPNPFAVSYCPGQWSVRPGFQGVGNATMRLHAGRLRRLRWRTRHGNRRVKERYMGRPLCEPQLLSPVAGRRLAFDVRSRELGVESASPRTHAHRRCVVILIICGRDRVYRNCTA
ncbi:hypothetical protein BAN20980_01443 [Burkholderia anthina]|uniref:Uncharacterized protein n=1 Tax=Burkholderia anthina TaxID=179879 RepID=A0A6P2G6Y9_9BURK|nr:hypothetical protein BAN20980_01443 [Burkholderia anthina]